MARTYTCDICGKSIGKMDRIDYVFRGDNVYACTTCSSFIEEIKLAESKTHANQYFQDKINQEGITSLGKAFAQHLIERYPADNVVPSDETTNTETPASTFETSRDNYQEPASTKIIFVFAILSLIIGIILLLIGLFSNNYGHEALIYAGIGSIITSVFLFVIVNISDDIHHLDYTVQALAKDNRNYQKQIIELLKAQQEK